MDSYIVSKYAFYFLENTWKLYSLEHKKVFIKKEVLKKNYRLVVLGFFVWERTS